MMKVRFEFVTGELFRDVYPNLRARGWKNVWPDPPEEIVVVHDGETDAYPAPIGIVRIFRRTLYWFTPDQITRRPDKGIERPKITHALQAAAIGGVWVDEEYRGRGVGFQMMVATMEWLKNRPGFDVAILNSGERTLYRNAGFRPIGRGLWGVHLHNRLYHLDGADPETSEWSLEPEGHF